MTNPNCYLVFDKRCINKVGAIPLVEALPLLLFASFVLKYEYNHISACIMQFLEKYVPHLLIIICGTPTLQCACCSSLIVFLGMCSILMVGMGLASEGSETVGSLAMPPPSTVGNIQPSL